jgi:hypothetical protein
MNAMRLSRLPILSPFFVLLLAACGGDTPGGCDDPDGCFETCTGADCDDLGVDTGDAEDAVIIDDTDDVPEDDVDAGCGGGFLCPCEAANDCAQGYCIEYAGDEVCTVSCLDTCPDPEWDCRLLQGTGGDLLSICVPPDDQLCTECDNDLSCGGLSDLCLELGDGQFCGSECADTGCPEGYLCEPMAGRDGDETLQCVPEFGVCSSCIDNDGDGYGVGPECLGADCDDLEPAAFADAPELCDGIDNDCDELEDEDFDFVSSLQHCGSCGSLCAPENSSEFACEEGECLIGSCDAGYDDCNADVTDGCEVFTNESLSHCGACEALCEFEEGIPICAEGVCLLDACRPNFGDCDGDAETNGCEIDLLASNEHCGGCGSSCSFRNAVGECLAGECSFIECLPGFENCNGTLDDGCEVELAVDPLHCGACTAACDLDNTSVHACADSVCAVTTCDGGFENCNGTMNDGCEINLASDVLNCGTCDLSCALDNANVSCVASECAVAVCLDDWFDCNEEAGDGCEIDLSSDEVNCGFCDFACDTTNVASGECSGRTCSILACEEGWGNCSGGAADGCEQDLESDIDHCGSCGNRCDQPNAVNVCGLGTCGVTECEAGFSDLDGDLSNGCDYECTFLLADDQPDNGFLDADCDGVDGNIEDSIFVSSIGDDRNRGQTPDNPVESISVGLALAALAGRSSVLISADAYAGTQLNVPSGVSMYGGYSTNFRNRDDTLTQYAATSNVALRISGATSRINIDRVRLTTPNQGTNGWTAAMTVINSGGNVFVTNSDIEAGDGGNGVAGGSGGNGSDGGNGANSTGQTGGSGGFTPGGGGPGGGGGTGRYLLSGSSGNNGASNSSSRGFGGAGGNDGLGCGDGDAETGGNGGNATNAGGGSNGGGGNNTGGVSGVVWSRSNGLGGSIGGVGGSGGGGGAGGGEECLEVCFFGSCICEGFCGTGRGGGGGGGGGDGARAGAGGTGGGLSAGILVSNSTIRLNNTSVEAGNGGAGGVGGAGGSGGNGGSGGSGATSSSAENGNGGDGGDGGDGGCGGGGGGGPSVGVWATGRSSVIQGTGTSISAGSGGSGGSSCGNSGASGISQATRGL